MKLFILSVAVCFLVTLTLKIKISDRKSRITKQEFLDLESQANLTRKQPLDDLDYITIPLNKLPFYENENEDIISYQNEIKALADKTIVNLTGMSNTDLKLTYGAANLDILSEYDRNFTELVRLLYMWGQNLYDNGKVNDAKTVLEFAIDCRTDVSKNYILLANIYKDKGELSKINNLINSANELNSLMKNSIINNLKSML